MSKTYFRGALLATTVFTGMAFAAPAAAQDTVQPGQNEQGTPAAPQPADNQIPAPGVAPQEAADQTVPAGDQPEEIVVTGTLIRNPNLEQSTPVNVTTADTIELKQSNVAEEVLREIPGVVSSIGSAVNNGNGGASYVDLRGLGSIRNIVLLDGNRIAPSGLAGRVDLNNIPLALVERVDALTGAAVTTYGADAITGVVNFITKKNFAGVELSVSDQITQKGDGNYVRADLTLGANFDDGRGNAVVSVGYQNSDPVYQGDRDFSFFQVDSYSGGQGGSGTSVPSRFSGTRPIDPATGLPSTNPAVANGGVRQIDPVTGRAVPTFATFNFNPYNIFQTPFNRYNIFGQANYEVSDAVEVYGRGLFSKNTVDTIIAPSGSFGGAVTINLNNPFLPAALRQQFCAFDINPAAAVYTPRFTPAQCAAAALATGPTDPNYRTVTATLSRRTVEVGPRISAYETQIFDARVGARGPITSTIDWDVSGAYGESKNTQTIQGYTLQSRFRQGVLVNGTLANPVCQDPSNGCVAVNVFGPEGSITPAAADFLSENSFSITNTTLAQGRGIVSGDFGFALPWATQPIGFALGAEYRRYTARAESDTLAKTPGELGGAGGASPDIGVNDPAGYKVYEGYAELIAPLIEDRPFFESLTLEAGARYSDYHILGAGGYNTWTYKAGGSWEPGAGVKFRGNYSRAVRAPNIGELFTPQTTGLTNLGIDPCAGAAPTTNADLRAICLAQGAPVGTIGSITNPTAGQANAVFGGNLELQPEKANTYTVGVVLQPDFLPRFSMSVDYYNIRIKDVIGSALPGDVINACFGNITAASAANPACTSIGRNPFTGGLDGDPATTPGLFLATTNLGELFTDGVDLIANYRRDLGFADLALSFVGNWTRNSEYNANVESEDSFFRECAGYYSVNCSFTGSIQPEFQFSQRTTLTFGKVDLSLLWRWIDAVKFEPRQFQDDLAFAEDAGCEDPLGADPDACIVEPEFRKIGAEHYFDFATRFNATDNITFTFNIQNLLNNKPKVVGNSIGSTTFNSGNVFPSTYDALGRRFAAGVRVKF
ncbi:TonB-dependent receptor domain-containing protein [Sphingomonas sp. GCM10030256]|uniref:TonB-dependent receptor domain-containing protein n=1 Tax=Sphingomonas sp. GCM10030256 TaxID=3273427 RepID=UPI0036134D96